MEALAPLADQLALFASGDRFIDAGPLAVLVDPGRVVCRFDFAKKNDRSCPERAERFFWRVSGSVCLKSSCEYG